MRSRSSRKPLVELMQAFMQKAALELRLRFLKAALAVGWILAGGSRTDHKSDMLYTIEMIGYL